MIKTSLAIAVSALLAAIALLHFYWAAGGKQGVSSATPSRNGVPLFRPSWWATSMVALALLACAGLVAAAGGLVRPPVGAQFVEPLAAIAGLIFAGRAIGDFRTVGLFKSSRDGRFGTLDTYVYSPLCACLGAAILLIVAL